MEQQITMPLERALARSSGSALKHADIRWPSTFRKGRHPSLIVRGQLPQRLSLGSCILHEGPLACSVLANLQFGESL
jgi:hypothetical protein